MSATTSGVETEQQRDNQYGSTSSGIDLENTPDASLNVDGSIDDLLAAVTTAETQPDIEVEQGCGGACGGCDGCNPEEVLRDIGETARERVAQEQTEAAYASFGNASTLGSDTNPAGNDPSPGSVDDQLHVDSAGTVTPEVEAEIHRTAAGVSESAETVRKLSEAESPTSATESDFDPMNDIDALLDAVTTADTQPDIEVEQGCGGACGGCDGCNPEAVLRDIGETVREKVAQEQVEAASFVLGDGFKIGASDSSAFNSAEAIDDILRVDASGVKTPEVQTGIEAPRQEVKSVQAAVVQKGEVREVVGVDESGIRESIRQSEPLSKAIASNVNGKQTLDRTSPSQHVQIGRQETAVVKQVASMLRQTAEIPAGLASKILKANLETLQSSSQAAVQMSDQDVERLHTSSPVSSSEVQEVAQQRVVERITEIVQKDADLDQTSATVVALAREGEISSLSRDVVAEIEIDKITEQIEVAIDMKDQSHGESEAIVQEVQLEELKGEAVFEEAQVSQERSEDAEVVAAAEMVESSDVVEVSSAEHEVDVALQIDEQIQEVHEVQIDGETIVEAQTDVIAQETAGAAQDSESLVEMIEEVLASEEVLSDEVEIDQILDEVEQSIENGASPEEIQELITELVEEQISSTQQSEESDVGDDVAVDSDLPEGGEVELSENIDSLPSENLTEILETVKVIQNEIVVATDGDRLEMLDMVQDAIQALEANQVLPAEEAARLYSLIAMTLRKKKARGKRGAAIDEMTELEMRQELAQELADLLNTLSELEDITELGIQSLLDNAVEQEQAEQSSTQSEETETAESEGIMMSGHHSGPKAELDIALMQEINNGNKYTGEEDEQPSIAV